MEIVLEHELLRAQNDQKRFFTGNSGIEPSQLVVNVQNPCCKIEQSSSSIFKSYQFNQSKMSSIILPQLVLRTGFSHTRNQDTPHKYKLSDQMIWNYEIPQVLRLKQFRSY